MAQQQDYGDSVYIGGAVVSCALILAISAVWMEMDPPAAPAAHPPAHGAPAGEHGAVTGHEPAHGTGHAPAHGEEPAHEAKPPAGHEPAHETRPATGHEPSHEAKPPAGHEPAPSHEAPAPAKHEPAPPPAGHEAPPPAKHGEEPAPAHGAAPHEAAPPPTSEAPAGEKPAPAPAHAPAGEKPAPAPAAPAAPADKPPPKHQEPYPPLPGGTPHGALAPRPGDRRAATAEEPPPPALVMEEEDEEEEAREDTGGQVGKDGPRRDANASDGRLLSSGPLLGYGGPQSIYVWASPVTRDAKLEVAIVEEPSVPGETMESRLLPMPPVPAGGFETTLKIDGLKPLTRYRYKVRADRVASEATSGVFRTGPLPGKPVKGRVAVVSCMHAKRWISQKAWLPLAADRPDLLLSIGDNIYANSTVPEVIREWYTLQRNVPEYAPLIRTVPQLAVWDDHDFGANDSDGTLANKERSLETWKAIWPSPSYGLPDAPGVFYASSFGDVDIFMLDDRWYRSPNLAPDDEKKDFLGEKQFAWLEEKVKASKAVFKLIVSGSTIYTNPSKKDCWRLYAKDRKRLLSLTQSVPGIVFVTGDIHTSIVSRIAEGPELGYPFYEIVSSGVAVNPSLFFYVTLDVDTVADDPTLGVRVHTLDKEGQEQKLDERVIKRSELTPGF